MPIVKELTDCRVLIVDDAKANVDMLVEALRGDYKLSVALDGEAALRAIERNAPDLLLLDEPMEGLAPVIVERLFAVFELLRDAGKFGIILVEQYVNLALSFAPSTVVLDRGRVIYDGRSADLAADPERMAAYFGASGRDSQRAGETVEA